VCEKEALKDMHRAFERLQAMVKNVYFYEKFINNI
jgi:hypothetical protein